MRHILLAAAVLAATPATAGQMLVPTPHGPVYAPAYRYSGPAPAGWLAPRGPWLDGYVRQYRPSPAPFVAGAILGAAATVLPPQVLPRPVPVQRPVAAPMPDAMDEIEETNPQGVTRPEIEGAIADFCTRNATASLCVKLQSR